MNVMIVDDSVMLQSRLRQVMLKNDNNNVITQAGSCKEAKQMFTRVRPDTVILDIALPDGSGVGLLQKFKQSDPAVRIIMMTNYPSEEFRKICMDLGAEYFFDKSNLNNLIKVFS
jgi:DNA-binding NarL/FixJ family response regulator